MKTPQTHRQTRSLSARTSYGWPRAIQPLARNIFLILINFAPDGEIRTRVWRLMAVSANMYLV